tara:strand:- start:1863 stop:2222 length:360 start_codon:yes stop_codon:yes gene_type:complete
MGLDQYAMVREKGEEVMYWRKHNRLQGWMAELWMKRTNNESPDQFNCVDLVLREEDIIKLEKDIEDRKLPETEGFFFGDDTYNDEETYKKYYLKDDMAFIEAAKEAIHEGKEVVYTCWW